MLPVKRPREEDAAAGGKKVVADGLLEFFIDLLQTLHKENENSTFSPLSISAALSLAYLGAAGKTRDEIGRLLRGPTEEKIEEFHKTISGILGTVIRNEEEKPNGTTVTLANGIFMQEPLNVKQSYLNDATTLYKSEVTKVDFEKNGEQTVAKINGWVSEKTKGRILQLFDGPLPPDTLFLLVNTLYFVSTWHYTFYESQTKVEKFFNGKEEIMVHMMRNTENVGYVKNKSLQFEAISMKYVEWGYRMCIILPNAEQSLHNVINNLQLKDVQDILTGSREPKAVYKIPRFKFSSSLSLKDTLSKLGIQEAFDTANFSNMLEEPVSLADVTHAAEIEIDENGTKASAVSAGRFHLMSGPSVFFTANRPFLALLYHQPTSTILFSTTVYNPTAA